MSSLHLHMEEGPQSQSHHAVLIQRHRIDIPKGQQRRKKNGEESEFAGAG